MKPPAVLGIGNQYRGDDAAGLLVVRALRAAGAAQDWDLLELSGEGAGLIDAWEARPCVVLVDAIALGGAPAGTVLRYDDPAALPPDTELRCSSHAFGVGAALALAEVLGRLPPALVLYGINGQAFAQGAAMTPAVGDAIARVAADIAQCIREEEWKVHA
jgi:hydrogenase maturation protease